MLSCGRWSRGISCAQVTPVVEKETEPEMGDRRNLDCVKSTSLFRVQEGIKK